MTETPPATGIATGDRVLLSPAGWQRPRAGDALAVFGSRPRFCTVRFDNGVSVLALANDCIPIPRRPPPDF